MEWNGFALLVILLVVLCIGIWYVSSYLEEQTSHPEPPKNTCSFRRINEVEGELRVNGKKLKTYDIGELLLDNLITIRFYSSSYIPLRINDIFLQGKSLYSFAPYGEWKQKAEYSLSVLKQLSNEGKLPPSLVCEVEDILLEVETVNRHAESGNLLHTPEQGYTWVF